MCTFAPTSRWGPHPRPAGAPVEFHKLAVDLQHKPIGTMMFQLSPKEPPLELTPQGRTVVLQH